jgi:PAS domain S-box-containing protein
MTITQYAEVLKTLKGLFLPNNLLHWAIAAIILIVLYLISLQNYILFHGIVELAGIAVAFSIFIIVWNTRRDINDAFFLIVGISFLFIGGIDLVHTLAYKGLGVFPGNNADLPTQLWIAARYFQSITFLIATFFIGKSITKDRKYDDGIVIAACTSASTLLFLSIFVWKNFPQCFIEGSGLTPFKIASEYIISLILITTIIILYYKREHFDPTVWKFLIAAQVFLILGELAFTSYISVYGFMNMLGHLFRLISVYLFYRAFVVISLTRPYDLLLRELKGNEHVMSERFKELNCLYGISALLEQPGISLNEILEKTVTLLPPSLQFPEIAEARIVLDGETFQTSRFRETPWMLVRQILVTGNPVGRVEVCYREARQVIEEGPFMVEEQHLLNAVAEHLGHIIDRVRTEKALQSSEKKYHTLFKNMLEGFAYCRMIYDDKGEPVDWVYLAVNKAFEQMTGLEKINGKRVLEAIPNIRELTPELFATYGRVASTGISETFEIDFKPLKIWLKVSVFSPETSYFVAVFEDITERKRAEDALKQVNNKLNLLSSITRHDIKNQLLALNGYIALSEEAIGNPVELKEFIAKEQKIADSIALQIAFTKDYESLGVTSPTWQNVSALVHDAGTSHPMRNIVLETQCPGLEIFADPLLEKVFFNLIDNSLRYGGEKMTAIRVTATEGDEALHITYEDDGTGISAYDKKGLFSKGFGKHTGLGLFLSREILSLTSITITENGEPGVGARFEITVPKGTYRFMDTI